MTKPADKIIKAIQELQPTIKVTNNTVVYKKNARDKKPIAFGTSKNTLTGFGYSK